MNSPDIRLQITSRGISHIFLQLATRYLKVIQGVVLKYMELVSVYLLHPAVAPVSVCRFSLSAGAIQNEICNRKPLQEADCRNNHASVHQIIGYVLLP
jgi:hypothetical protein